MNQPFCKRLEEGFGWAEAIDGMRERWFAGREKLVLQFVLTMSAYNMVRMRNLGAVEP